MPYDDEIPPYGDVRVPSHELNRLTESVIGAAIEVHRELGPGLPEHAYRRAMQLELTLRHIPFEPEKVIDIFYKSHWVGKGRIDLFVAGMLVVELKAVETLSPVNHSQVKSYLQILKLPLGLLLNFNVPLMKDGIRRIIAS